MAFPPKLLSKWPLVERRGDDLQAVFQIFWRMWEVNLWHFTRIFSYVTFGISGYTFTSALIFGTVTWVAFLKLKFQANEKLCEDGGNL